MSAALPFQAFQQDFGRHLRDPRRRRPTGVSARGAGLYRELLRNKLEGFLLACFPVTKDILGERRWSGLVDGFFRDARCQSPYFRDIPRDFVDWLSTRPRARLPAWLPELAHYEWAELAVDVMEAAETPCDAAGDPMHGIPVLAPALLNLSYAWPVHRIGTAWRPRRPRPTCLLVYRQADDAVAFVEVTALSARVVARLQEGGHRGRDAVLAVAREIGHAETASLLAHGGALLAELRTLGVIRGTRP